MGLICKIQTGPWGWCTQGCPWDLPKGPLSVLKLLRNSMPFAGLYAAGSFTGSREGKYSFELCKGEKHIARSCGAYKPGFAFLKYFSFRNPLNLTPCSKDTLTITLRFHICEVSCFWARLLPEKRSSILLADGFTRENVNKLSNLIWTCTGVQTLPIFHPLCKK